MIKDYYEKLRLDFFNKIDAIKTQNYFEFYKHSPALLIALNLAYFVLAEEQIVSLDKNSKNITSRYKLNISPKIIDDLFDGKAFYQKLSGITKKEENGDNIWFLNALRNAILHGGIEDIDLEEMTINVSSTHSLNNLSANIPIEFFSSFIDKFSKSRFKNDNTLNIYLIEDKPYMFSQLVGKLQNGFNFQVKIKAEDPIEDAEFIKNQIQSLYDEVLTIYGEYLQEKMPEDENFKDMTQKLLQISDIRNSKNYTILVKEIIKEQLVKSIQKHFPVYNVSIEEIECEFLKKDKTLTKHGNMIYPETILDYLRYKGTLSFTDYLSQIEYLYQNYTENSKFVSKVMSFIGPQDTKKLTPGFIQKRIHAIRKEKGGSFTYDIRLAKILSIEHPPNSNDFSRIHNTDSQTAREISRKIYNYKKARNPDEMLIPILKKQYSDFFEKYNQIFRNKGDISDEDINIYNEISNADKMLEFYEMCVSDRSKILVGLLYVFGINMYVINKENNFDDLEDPNYYSFMDKLDIEMYSLVAMSELENLKLKKEHCVKELKDLQKKYKKYSTNPKFPKDKLDALQSDIDRKQQEIIDINHTIATTPTKKFRNRNMALDNNNKRKASIIRNCLSHNGRIRIVYENNYKGKTTVLLSDHNGNNSTAFIKCPIDELFKFLRQDTFRNSIHLQTPNEHTKITPIQALENALEQGITTNKINEANTIEILEQNSEHSNEGETKDD